MRFPWSKKPELKAQYEQVKQGSSRRGTFNGPKPRDTRKDLTKSRREELVKNARGVERNSGFGAQVVQDFRLYAVGDQGFTPRPMGGDAEWQANAKAYWKRWSRRCDVTGRYSLLELCHMIAGIRPIDGESFALKTRVFGEPAIQMLETHQLDGTTNETENLFDGIEFTEYGRPLSYGVIQRDGTIARVRAGSVLHLHDVYRPSATRFAPSIQHSLNNLIDEKEVLTAEIHAVKDNQDVTRTIKSDDPTLLDDDGDFQVVTGQGGGTTSTGTNIEELQQRLGGKIARLGSNEELTSFQSNRPNSTFVGLLEHMRRDASQGNVPYEFGNNPNGVSGAAVRLVVSKSNRIFRWESSLIIRKFLEPLWFWVIGDAIDRGFLPAVPKWNEAEWTMPRSLTVDVGRDAAQNRADIEGGLKTIDEDFEERGKNTDDEQAIRVARARSIMTACGYPATDPIPLWMIYKPSTMSIQDPAFLRAAYQEGNNES